ncbi:MAG: lmo0937 family membrane protein [Flavobacteriales bacterium]
MKKLISLSSVFIIVTVLLSSCATHLTKRHYSNGYHVSHSENKQKVAAHNEEEKTAQHQSKKNETVVPTQPMVNNETTVAVKPDVTNTVPVVANNQTNQSNVVSNPSTAQPLKQKTSVLKHPVSTIKKALLDRKKISRISHDGEGHSLLWIIIVVILILWAIGFLADGFGLGGLIHLLLVIALVLFILWLLRVL